MTTRGILAPRLALPLVCRNEKVHILVMKRPITAFLRMVLCLRHGTDGIDEERTRGRESIFSFVCQC